MAEVTPVDLFKNTKKKLAGSFIPEIMRMVIQLVLKLHFYVWAWFCERVLCVPSSDRLTEEADYFNCIFAFMWVHNMTSRLGKSIHFYRDQTCFCMH